MKIKTIFKLIDIKTLGASFFSVLFGSIYSWYEFKRLNICFLIGLLLAMALIQTATNMFNDYMDYRKGTDGNEKVDEKVLISGDITPKQIINLIVIFLFIALVIGCIIAYFTSWIILLVGVAGALVAFLYSAGPRPISYTPMGELASGITMGIGITSTVVFVQTNQFYWKSIWMAIPTAIYIAFIMFSNNLCDRESDLLAGRHTLPGLIGFQISRKIWLFFPMLMVIITTLFIWGGIYPLWTILAVLILINYIYIYKRQLISQEDFRKDNIMVITGKIGAQYHLLMIIGLLIAILTNS